MQGVQVALCLLLLVSAGLFVRTLANLDAIDPMPSSLLCEISALDRVFFHRQKWRSSQSRREHNFECTLKSVQEERAGKGPQNDAPTQWVLSDANNEITGQRTFLGDNALIQNGS